MDFMLALHKSVVVLNLCSLSDFDVNEYEFLHTCNEGLNMTWIVPSAYFRATISFAQIALYSLDIVFDHRQAGCIHGARKQ